MPSTSILSRIHEIERFGVGSFTDSQIAEKTDAINKLMGGRMVPFKPRISVVVPAYQEEKYILGTLRSLAEQTNQNCEFLIVSNGEPAGNLTQQMCEASGFRVVHDARGGISRARQTGLEAARGDIVVTTDADTIHHFRWLDRIDEIMADERILCSADTWRTTSKVLSVRMVFGWLAFTHRLKNAINPRLVTGVSEAASFYWREAAFAAGGYDPAIMLSEGLMMFRKLRRSNVPIIFADEELVVYTSGRRLERQGAFRWLGLGTWNAGLQAFGKKGVKAEAYPHIR